MIGLKRGEVAIVDHQSEWDEIAAETIRKLKEIFGDTALDIKHIGSTAIGHIKAKPIIDIVIGVRDFDSITDVMPCLESIGVTKSTGQPFPDIILFSKDDPKSDARTHNIQVVLHNSVQWQNHINFRDYMNTYPQKAAVYEELKNSLAKQYPDDVVAYSNGKSAFIKSCLLEARIHAEMKQKLDIIAFEPINKGWSCDNKYFVTASDGTKYLLRVTPHEKSASREDMFKMMQQVSALGVSMCQPIEFGVC